MNWEIGIDMYTLICIKWITNKNLLYKKINKIKFKKKRIEEAGSNGQPRSGDLVREGVRSGGADRLRGVES